MSHGVLLDVKPKHQGNLLDFMCWITELDVKTVNDLFVVKLSKPLMSSKSPYGLESSICLTLSKTKSRPCKIFQFATE